MAILRSVEATPDERAAYVKHANAMRKARGEAPEADEPAAVEDEDAESEGLESLPVERDRKSGVEGKRVSVRVDLGGRRNIKQKRNNTKTLTMSQLHQQHTPT